MTLTTHKPQALHRSQVFGAWFYDVPNADPVRETPPPQGKLLGMIPGKFESWEDVPVRALQDLRPSGYLCIVIGKGDHTISTVISG
jgi:hypothetical protein